MAERVGASEEVNQVQHNLIYGALMEDVGYVRYIFKPKLIQRFNFGVREGGAVREVQLGGSRGQSKCTIQRTIQVHYTTIQSK